MAMILRVSHRLWREDDGFLASADLILVTTIVVLGMLVGLVTLRDQVLQELGDLATAVGQLNQSYSVASFTTAGFSVAGSVFADQSDFCELGTTEGSNNNDVAGEAPGCIEFVAASGE